MILRAYSIQDRKTGAFSPPFFCTFEADAIRMVQGLLDGAENTVSKYPEDFHLYRVGAFDDQAGVFVQDVHEQITTIISLLRSSNMRMDLAASEVE